MMKKTELGRFSALLTTRRGDDVWRMSVRSVPSSLQDGAVFCPRRCDDGGLTSRGPGPRGDDGAWPPGPGDAPFPAPWPGPAPPFPDGSSPPPSSRASHSSAGAPAYSDDG